MLEGRDDVVELVSKDEEVKEVADGAGESNPESVGERKLSGWRDGADCACALGDVTTLEAGSSTCPPGADLPLP